jgi:aspartate oxidase
MFFDEIVIGSSLAVLSVVLALPASARVLVIGGQLPGNSFITEGGELYPALTLDMADWARIGMVVFDGRCSVCY